MERITQFIRTMLKSEYIVGMLLWAGLDQIRDMITFIRNLMWNVFTTNVRLTKRQTTFLRTYLNTRILRIVYTSSSSLRRRSNDQTYSLGPDTYYGSWIFHRGRLFKVSDFELKESKDSSYVSSTVSMLGFGGVDLIGSMLDAGEKEMRKRRKRYLEIYSVYRYNDGLAWSKGFESESSKPGRSIESVILPLRSSQDASTTTTTNTITTTTESEALLEDAKEFLRSELWYTERGIPFRRGYLLYGIPGGGKTSLVVAIASEMSLPIYTLSLSSSLLNDETLVRLLQEISNTRCILLLEDVDVLGSLCMRRSDKMKKKQEEKKDNDELTLSGLLNALDGTLASNGRLLFMTTNIDISKLDPALIRSGRIDYHLEFKYVDRYQAEKMFLHFYHERRNHSEIRELAKRFASAVGGGRSISAADIQSHLIRHKRDPNKALGSWTS